MPCLLGHGRYHREGFFNSTSVQRTSAYAGLLLAKPKRAGVQCFQQQRRSASVHPIFVVEALHPAPLPAAASGALCRLPHDLRQSIAWFAADLRTLCRLTVTRPYRPYITVATLL